MKLWFLCHDECRSLSWNAPDLRLTTAKVNEIADMMQFDSEVESSAFRLLLLTVTTQARISGQVPDYLAGKDVQVHSSMHDSDYENQNVSFSDSDRAICRC